MKKKLISGLFLMLWMALLIAAMVYPQGIFPVLAASGVWVACLLTWAVIPVALAALIKNSPPRPGETYDNQQSHHPTDKYVFFSGNCLQQRCP